MNARQRPVKTIADIARLAGVSKSTVSRALNDSLLISKKTRDRIQEIAREHHFETHRGARNLSLQRNQTIALLIPINPEIGYFITDPFFLQLVGAVAHALSSYDYDLLIAQAHETDQHCIRRYLQSKRADGLILVPNQAHQQELAELNAARVPVIVWGSPTLDLGYCSVRSDDRAGARMAAQHLLELGRRRIAFLGGIPEDDEGLQRSDGYQDALETVGIPVDPTLMDYGDYTSRSGYEAMQRVLSRAPELDAVFASSDVMAIAAMEALREHGRRIPDDVAVVGFDDIPMAAYCSPPLTTVRQDISTAGRLLVQNLLQYVQDGIITTTILPVELVVRKSSSPG